MTDLDRLIEAVEAGTVGNVTLQTFDDAQHRDWFYRAYYGSRCAAVALKNALLPGQIWHLRIWRARKGLTAVASGATARHLTAKVHDLATPRALLLATLKAYRERMKG